MSILNIVKPIKKIYKEAIVLVRTGKFYTLYGRDSYIISYLFGYKLRKVENQIYTCGFPASSYNKVLAKIENKKIDYLILDRRNQYEVDKIYTNKNLNQYSQVYQIAKKEVVINARIENIYEYLKRNRNKEEIKEILLRMEDIINEK